MLRLVITSLLLLLLLLPATVSAGHKGPRYGKKPPSGCKLDPKSATKDSSDGATVVWTDRWNQKHSVTLGPREQVTVVFPIPRGGSWVWYDDDKERTGFARNSTWVEATFSYNDGDLRIRSTGWYPKDEILDSGPVFEALKSVKAAVYDIKDIVSSGARTASEVISIGQAAGLID